MDIIYILGGTVMSSDGKRILLSIIGLPLLAVFGALIIFGGKSDTLIFVFGTNLIPMLISGLFSGLLIRTFNKSGSGIEKIRRIALAPITVTVAFGVVWYLLSLVNLGGYDSGREYFAGPLYLIGLSIGAGVIASIAYFIAPKTSNTD
ncbi:MAG: hypothetical protein VYA80_07005 [Pseudomonadota bacterium]|nr:hypothetical protein [Pseudomonadota bacterium]